MENNNHISIAAVVALLFIIGSIIAGNFLYQPFSGHTTGFVTIEVIKPNEISAKVQSQTDNLQISNVMVNNIAKKYAGANNE